MKVMGTSPAPSKCYALKQDTQPQFASLHQGLKLLLGIRSIVPLSAAQRFLSIVRKLTYNSRYIYYIAHSSPKAELSDIFTIIKHQNTIKLH